MCIYQIQPICVYFMCKLTVYVLYIQRSGMSVLFYTCQRTVCIIMTVYMCKQTDSVYIYIRKQMDCVHINICKWTDHVFIKPFYIFMYKETVLISTCIIELFLILWMFISCTWALYIYMHWTKTCLNNNYTIIITVCYIYDVWTLNNK